MRTGPELIRASNAYAGEDIGKTWRLVLTTFGIHALGWAVMLLTDAWYIELPLGVLMGLLVVREFIFYHDYCHGAIFRKSRWGKHLMTFAGYQTMAVPSVWRETHNYHHRNNAKLTGSGIGSYPTVSLRMYRRLAESDRRRLKAIRSPLSIVLGVFTTFMVGMAYAPFKRDPKKHAMAPWSVVIWWAVFAAVWLLAGFSDAFFGIFLPGFISSAAGSYLFYAQHNFPDAELKGRREWDYTHAALRSSSYFVMSPLMHWFTGNIGYHHVHHLNSRIPFYRLPEAMEAMPDLQNPGRTSWKLSDIRACLNCSVWDEQQGRMISFEEADATMVEQRLAAK